MALLYDFIGKQEKNNKKFKKILKKGLTNEKFGSIMCNVRQRSLRFIFGAPLLFVYLNEKLGGEYYVIC